MRNRMKSTESKTAPSAGTSDEHSILALFAGTAIADSFTRSCIITSASQIDDMLSPRRRIAYFIRSTKVQNPSGSNQSQALFCELKLRNYSGK